MKIIVSQDVYCNSEVNLENIIRIKKCYESDCVPHIGDKILNGVFADHNDFLIINEYFDFESNECYVELKGGILPCDKEKALNIIDMHGWDAII